MELRQIRYAEAVVRCGGFTRAAEDLHVAQPAISAQIRRLEHELGVALFARTSRRVGLTEAGEVFLVRARRALAELEAARAEVDEVAAVLRGRVSLGVTSTVGGLDLPAALAEFARRYPGVRLAVRSGLVATQLDALSAGEVDLVLGPVHEDLPASYAATPLASDRLVLITTPARLPRGRVVELADLGEEPFVCLPEGSGLRERLDALGRRAGFVPDVRFEASDPDGVRELVAAGLGIALTAASATDRPGAPVDVHDVHPTMPHPPFGLIRLAGSAPGPGARALGEHLVRAAAPGRPAPGDDARPDADA